MTIARTLPRHTILSDVAAGEIQRVEFANTDPIYVNRPANTVYRAAEVRAINFLINDGVVEIDADSGQLVLANDGPQVLAEWDSEHPESMLEINGEWKVAGSIAAISPAKPAVVITNGVLTLMLDYGDGIDTERVAEALAVRLSGGVR